MRKMGHYIWYACFTNFGTVRNVSAYDPCEIVRDGNKNESIMMIPGTYAEMHRDYD